MGCCSNSEKFTDENKKNVTKPKPKVPKKNPP